MMFEKGFLILPEIIVIGAAAFFFGAAMGKVRSATILLAAGSSAALAALGSAVATFSRHGLLFGVYQIDVVSQTFKIIILGGLLLILLCTPRLRGITSAFSAEYFLFLFSGCVGLCLMTSTAELMTMILSIEIASYAFYVLVPLRSKRYEREPFEAGIKYMFFGGAATALTLYGMSYLYGMARSTYLSNLARELPVLLAAEPLAVIGLVLFLVGICFKLGLAPLHYWMPDAFTGAAHETACAIATLPKVAALCLLLRIFALASTSDGTVALVFGTMAVLSMSIGNLSALGQRDIKRLLAYSGIAHAGYLVVGMLASSSVGMAAVIYYAVGYVVMLVACFFVLYQLAPHGENITIEDLHGLARRSPLLAVTLTVAAIGLAGIPPTIGFTGKFLMFAAALKHGWYIMVGFAIVNVCIAAFYYLRLIRAVYTGVSERAERITLPFHTAVSAVSLIGAIVVAGIVPRPLFENVLPAATSLLARF
ncbi:MAG: NADH-quinone oxidoreductase subunit N [Desulfobacterota bacterium]|nr:NADH-quinone oxidoreductase subunit N [Thermodesulfobacteriota bacterium]